MFKKTTNPCKSTINFRFRRHPKTRKERKRKVTKRNKKIIRIIRRIRRIFPKMKNRVFPLSRTREFLRFLWDFSNCKQITILTIGLTSQLLNYLTTQFHNFKNQKSVSWRRQWPVLQRGRAVFAMWRLLLGRQRVHFGRFLKKDEKMSRKCLAVSGEVCTFALAFAQKTRGTPPEGA